jgi:hypothetical protein
MSGTVLCSSLAERLIRRTPVPIYLSDGLDQEVHQCQVPAQPCTMV